METQVVSAHYQHQYSLSHQSHIVDQFAIQEMYEVTPECCGNSRRTCVSTFTPLVVPMPTKYNTLSEYLDQYFAPNRLDEGFFCDLCQVILYKLHNIYKLYNIKCSIYREEQSHRLKYKYLYLHSS